MSSIDKAFYSQFAPVLNEPGWWETNAAGYGDVFFRNTIYQEPGGVEITVGIVVCPSSWRYCASFSTSGSMRAIDVPRLPITTPWSEVHDYYLNHGLAAYTAYKEDLDARIEAHDTRIAWLKADIPDLKLTPQESHNLRLMMRSASRIKKEKENY